MNKYILIDITNAWHAVARLELVALLGSLVTASVIWLGEDNRKLIYSFLSFFGVFQIFVSYIFLKAFIIARKTRKKLMDEKIESDTMER